MKAAEQTPNRPGSLTVRRLTRLAMLTAISVVLLMVLRIPFPPAPFLEYDAADVPIFLATFAYGPVAGFIVAVLASLVQGFTVSSGSSFIGIIMHILATGSYALVAGNIYRRNKTMKTALFALAAGTVTMTLVMVGCNLIFTPIFLNTPVEAVLKMIVPVIIPFNLLKAGINSAFTFLLYKQLGKLLKV